MDELRIRQIEKDAIPNGNAVEIVEVEGSLPAKVSWGDEKDVRRRKGHRETTNGTKRSNHKKIQQ